MYLSFFLQQPFHLHRFFFFFFNFSEKVIKLQPIVDFQWFIDFYSFRITAFITGPIQESLIMNQASGQANKSANQLAIMSIVFNFTMTMWKTLKRETKMNDVHSRKCLCNVHFACLRIGASKEFSQSSNKEREIESIMMVMTRQWHGHVYILASLQYQAFDASVILIQFKMQYALVLISHLARQKHGQFFD